MTAKTDLLTHSELIAHIKWLHRKDERESVGMIRLHKHAYFAFGVYSLFASQVNADKPFPFLAETPFANAFVNGKFGALIKDFQTFESVEIIPCKEWQPTTLNGMYFYGIMDTIKAVFEGYGDFQLVELTHDGSAFKHYYKKSPNTLAPMATHRILTEMQERFA